MVLGNENISGYKILMADNEQSLEAEVEQYIDDGWELVDGVQLTVRGDYIQAVTKKIKNVKII